MRWIALACLLVGHAAHANPAEIVKPWLRAVYRGKVDEVAALSRKPLMVISSGVCLPGGSPDHPRMTGVRRKQSLARVVAALHDCLPASARVARTADGLITLSWGQESITELRLEFDADGKLRSIADVFAYGGP